MSAVGSRPWLDVVIGVWAAATVAGPRVLAPADRIANGFFDDAFYYSQIARNVVSGQGCSFDGLHVTNGFHPLWLVFQLPVMLSAPGDVWPLRAIAVVEFGLLAVALVVVHRIIRVRLGWPAATIAVTVPTLLPAASRTLAGGLESALALCLITLAWAAWLGERRGALSILIALAAAARLEAILILPVVVLLDLRRGPLTFLGIGRLAAPSLAALASFSVWCKTGFGTWGPISGQVKRRYLVDWLETEPPLGELLLHVIDLPWLGQDLVLRAFRQPAVAFLPPAGVLALLLVPVVGLVCCWRWRTSLAAKIAESSIIFPLLVAASMLALDKVALLIVPRWYTAPLSLATGLVAAILIGQTRAQRAVAVLLLALGVVHVVRLVDGLSSPDHTARFRREAAIWVSEETPEDAIVGSWNAGAIGWFADRPVVNLDGLVNDITYYQRVQLGKDLAGYIDDVGIEWLVDQACASGAIEPYLSRTGSEDLGERIELVQTFLGESGCGAAVWRIRPE